MTNPLQALSQAGVAGWLDDLSRERLRTGDLADLFRDKHLVGVDVDVDVDVDEAYAVCRLMTFAADVTFSAPVATAPAASTDGCPTKSTRDAWAPISGQLGVGGVGGGL